MGLGQSQQVSLGGQDLSEPVAERRAQITGLAGLLGDDQDRHGRQPDLNPLMFQPWDGKYPEPACPSRPAVIPSAAPANARALPSTVGAWDAISPCRRRQVDALVKIRILSKVCYADPRWNRGFWS